MKRIIVVVGSIFALVLGACLPFSITSTPSPGPTVDVAGTADTVIKTAAAQTLTAQPTSTSAPLTYRRISYCHPNANRNANF